MKMQVQNLKYGLLRNARSGNRGVEVRKSRVGAAGFDDIINVGKMVSIYNYVERFVSPRRRRELKSTGLLPIVGYC